MKPFIAKPASGPAVAGIVDHEGLVAMGGDSGLIADSFNGSNSVQPAAAGRPKFDFVNEPKQFHAFAIVSFSGFFCFYGVAHGIPEAGLNCSVVALTAMHATPIWRGSCSSLLPIFKQAALLSPRGMPGAAIKVSGVIISSVMKPPELVASNNIRWVSRADSRDFSTITGTVCSRAMALHSAILRCRSRS